MQKLQKKLQKKAAQSTTSPQLVETLKLRFDLPLRPNEIYQFRGAIADAAGWEHNLFHNHGYQPPEQAEQPNAASNHLTKAADTPQQLSKAVFYRYPLIQYRSEGGKAAIWAMGDGIEAIRQWMNDGLDNFRIGGRRRPLKIVDFKGTDFHLRRTETMQTYRLMDWLALNQANYQRWQKMERYTERITLLEEVLVGQILSFATAAQWQIPNRFEVQLYNVRSARPVHVHGTDKMAFNILYKTNLLLPPAMAVGRSVAFGFGVQQPTKEQV